MTILQIGKYVFNRSIFKKLNEWKKKKSRKPLVLRGARQVGKTTVIDMFSEKFSQYISLNLESLDDRKIFDDSLNIDEIVDKIFFSNGKNKNDEDTLIFIDEIQNSSTAISALRFFYEKFPQYYVIAAGSLLESLINKNYNFPVGRVEYLVLRPMSFEEYLLAQSNNRLIEEFNSIPISNYAFDELTKHFKFYTIFGGFPEVIKTYLETEDYSQLSELFTNLIVAYKDDVEKYAKSTSNSNVIRHIIEQSFANVGNRIKFEGFGQSNYKSREIGEGFRTLEKTFLLSLVYPTTTLETPYLPNRRKLPRLYLIDNGLVNFSTNRAQSLVLSNDLHNAFDGKTYENIVGQELLVNQYSPDYKLKFWNRDKKQSSAEIDYIIPYKTSFIPIEVKAGVVGKLRSLHQVMDKNNIWIAVRLYNGKLSVDKVKTPNGKKFLLLNLPIFLASMVEKYIEWVELKYTPI